MKRLFIILMVIVLLVAMTIVTNAVFSEELNDMEAIVRELQMALEAGDMDRANKAFSKLLEMSPSATLEDLKTPFPRGQYKYLFYSELIGLFKNAGCIRARSKHTPETRILLGIDG